MTATRENIPENIPENITENLTENIDSVTTLSLIHI